MKSDLEYWAKQIERRAGRFRDLKQAYENGNPTSLQETSIELNDFSINTRRNNWGF